MHRKLIESIDEDRETMYEEEELDEEEAEED